MTDVVVRGCNVPPRDKRCKRACAYLKMGMHACLKLRHLLSQSFLTATELMAMVLSGHAGITVLRPLLPKGLTVITAPLRVTRATQCGKTAPLRWEYDAPKAGMLVSLTCSGSTNTHGALTHTTAALRRVWGIPPRNLTSLGQHMNCGYGISC